MEELESSEYTGIVLCRNCRKEPASQNFIYNVTNREIRVCESCFAMAIRTNVVLKEEAQLEL